MKSLRNAAVLQSILDRISSVPPDCPARWGRMTAPQMICHLTDSFLVAMGGRNASMATGIFQRTAMKFGGLYVPLPWPKGVPTRPEIDQRVGGTPPAEFEADRARLIAAIGRFTAQQCDFEWRPHPIFGNMNQWEWMRWGYLHTDHHLRQFRR